MQTTTSKTKNKKLFTLGSACLDNLSVLVKVKTLGATCSREQLSLAALSFGDICFTVTESAKFESFTHLFLALPP